MVLVGARSVYDGSQRKTFDAQVIESAQSRRRAVIAASMANEIEELLRRRPAADGTREAIHAGRQRVPRARMAGGPAPARDRVK